MQTDIHQLIDMLADKLSGPQTQLTDIRDALADGEALALLGITNQAIVEAAYHETYDLIMTDHVCWGDVQ